MKKQTKHNHVLAPGRRACENKFQEALIRRKHKLQLSCMQYMIRTICNTV